MLYKSKLHLDNWNFLLKTLSWFILEQKESSLSGGARPAFCNLNTHPGEFFLALPRFFFNKKTGLCEKFTFGGGRGNKNNFQTIEDCEKTCVIKGFSGKYWTVENVFGLQWSNILEIDNNFVHSIAVIAANEPLAEVDRTAPADTSLLRHPKTPSLESRQRCHGCNCACQCCECWTTWVCK